MKYFYSTLIHGLHGEHVDWGDVEFFDHPVSAMRAVLREEFPIHEMTRYEAPT